MAPFLTIQPPHRRRDASPTPSHRSTASSANSLLSPYLSDHSAASSCTDLSEPFDEPTLKNAPTTVNAAAQSRPTHAETQTPPIHTFLGPRSFIATFIAAAISVEHTLVYNNIRYGKKGADFSVCLLALGLRDRKLVEAATRLQSMFIPNDTVARIWVDNNTFVSFKCATPTLSASVLYAVAESPDYGFSNVGGGRTAIVEYSSPNIAKPFHIGHLRPTILGAFIRNLYLKNGWNVNAMNYLGDWGTQFGMIAVGFDKYGDEKELLKEPCKHLFEVYVAINKDANHDPSVKEKAAEAFKLMEDGDEDALRQWRRFRDLTVERYGKDYDQLNAHFDTYSAESEVGLDWQDKAILALDDLRLIQLVEKVPGRVAKFVDLSAWGLQAAVLRKGNGTSIYLSRDIAEAARRYELYNFDKMIYVVASQQDVHLARVLKILELMRFDWATDGRIQHINHGLVHGPKNTKLSTRTGNVIPLDDAIHELANILHDQMCRRSRRYHELENPSRIAEEQAITVLKINDFSRRRIKNYGADSVDVGNLVHRRSGLYIQHTYARLVSLRRRNDHLRPYHPASVDTSLLRGEDIHRLIFLLGKYPDVIRVTLATHQPCKVVDYTFDLCHAVMRIWKHAKVYGEKDEELAKARLFMFECTLKVLRSAMELLTLRPQDQF